MTRRVFIVACAVICAISAALLWTIVRGPVPAPLLRTGDAAARLRLTLKDAPYRTIGGWTGHLDLYRPPGKGLKPVILFIHGGGWLVGSKEHVTLWAAPSLLDGYAVVAVNYRLAETAKAPAAVEDVRCALQWIGAHGPLYGLDTKRIVTAGDSAGGHLALMAALLRPEDGFDRCGYGPAPPVRAVVNWYGVTDIPDLLNDAPLDGAELPFARVWIGSDAGADDLARRMSPVNWIRAGAPPVITIHGVDDGVVPFRQATALHDALEKHGVPHELMAIPAGGHGDFVVSAWLSAMRRVSGFLARHGG